MVFGHYIMKPTLEKLGKSIKIKTLQHRLTGASA